MPLPYLPESGEVLICAFDDVAQGAEMIKRRPVVVVSTKSSHHRRLCTVVPISTTAPIPPRLWHHQLSGLNITGWKASAAMWAKCDMLATVAFDRLNAPYLKSRHGRRYTMQQVSAADLDAIQTCLTNYLNLRPKNS
jgi:uncharacterized protein YifN (PemK superfamily)